MPKKTLKDHVESHKRGLVEEALRLNDGQLARAAEVLGVSRTSLWRLAKKYKLDTSPSKKFSTKSKKATSSRAPSGYDLCTCEHTRSEHEKPHGCNWRLMKGENRCDCKKFRYKPNQYP